MSITKEPIHGYNKIAHFLKQAAIITIFVRFLNKSKDKLCILLSNF